MWSLKMPLPLILFHWPVSTASFDVTCLKPHAARGHEGRRGIGRKMVNELPLRWEVRAIGGGTLDGRGLSRIRGISGMLPRPLSRAVLSMQKYLPMSMPVGDTWSNPSSSFGENPGREGGGGHSGIMYRLVVLVGGVRRWADAVMLCLAHGSEENQCRNSIVKVVGGSMWVLRCWVESWSSDLVRWWCRNVIFRKVCKL